MKNKTSLLFLGFGLLLITIMQQACADSAKNKEIVHKSTIEEKNQIVKKKVDRTRFPNDRSELAILMRDLYDEVKANKPIVAAGNNPEVQWTMKYSFMKKAKPTEPKNSGPEFEAFVDNYLNTLAAFEHAEGDELILKYNAMIESCLSCHSDRCPGPMETIGKLAI